MKNVLAVMIVAIGVVIAAPAGAQESVRVADPRARNVDRALQSTVRGDMGRVAGGPAAVRAVKGMPSLQASMPRPHGAASSRPRADKPRALQPATVDPAAVPLDTRRPRG